MIDPLSAVLERLPGGAPDVTTRLVPVINDVVLTASGNVIATRSDSPDYPGDWISEALITGQFDRFPDPLRMTFRGRVLALGPVPTMTGLGVRIYFSPRDNPSLSGEVSQVGPLAADGKFELLVDLVFDTAAQRPLTLHGTAAVTGANVPCLDSAIELTNINLEWFLAFVDFWEPRSLKLGAVRSSLGFLSSIRKVVNTSPDFDKVVRTVKAPYPSGGRDDVAPLFGKDIYRDPEKRSDRGRNMSIYQLVKAYPDIGRRMGIDIDKLFSTTRAARLKDSNRIRINGEAISISHVLIGVEGGRRQDPIPDPPQLAVVPMMAHPDKLVTWAGDLGGCLSRFVTDNYYKQDPNALTLEQYIAQTASRADLIGDIDGVNLAFEYDEAKSLAENLRAYFVTAGNNSARRYSRFVEVTENYDGQRALTLDPGANPPRLTSASRQFIANQILEAAILTLIRRTELDWTPPKPQPNEEAVRIALAEWMKKRVHWKTVWPEVEPMMQVNSPQVQRLTTVFVELLDRGLAAEAAP